MSRKTRASVRQAGIEAAKASAQAKRAELGLDPRPEENLEYEAQEAARKARRRRRKG